MLHAVDQSDSNPQAAQADDAPDSPQRRHPDPASEQRLGHLRQLPAFLRSQVRGQEDVIPRVCSVLRRGELGLSHSGRPRGSFLFLGPTGVGKTEITLQFSQFLFGDRHLYRFDMSEFQAEDAVKLMIGAHRDDPGRLGMILDQLDHGTLLFDEMEKAEHKILDLFLQMTDAARITLATGKTYDLSRFYIVFTSNIGSADIMRMEKAPYSSLERHVLGKASQALRPEFFARITEKLVFRKLNYTTQLEVAELMLKKEIDQLAAKGYQVAADQHVINFLVMKGYHPYLGARPMRAAIEKYIQDAVADALLSGGEGCGQLLTDYAGDRLILASGENE